MKHYDCFVDQEVGFKHEGFNYIGVITELNEIEDGKWIASVLDYETQGTLEVNVKYLLGVL